MATSFSVVADVSGGWSHVIPGMLHSQPQYPTPRKAFFFKTMLLAVSIELQNTEIK